MRTMALTVLAEVNPGAVFPGVQDTAFGSDLVRFLDPDEVHATCFDFGLQRGDGIFEATEVNTGVALAQHLHLHRLARSARIVGLPDVDEGAWAEAVEAVVQSYDAPNPGLLKIMVTRGQDGHSNPGRRIGEGIPSAWIYVDEKLPQDAGPSQITTVTMSREITRTSAVDAPWLLLGAKTLSYAMNMAIEREVARRGVDQAILTTLDGFVLEGSRKSVVLRTGDRLVTPDPRIGILHGTSQQEFFAFAASQGLEVGYADVTVEELHQADQIWMGSSSTMQSVVELDGVRVDTDVEFTRAANEYVRTQREAVDAWTATAPSPFTSPLP